MQYNYFSLEKLYVSLMRNGDLYASFIFVNIAGHPRRGLSTVYNRKLLNILWIFRTLNWAPGHQIHSNKGQRQFFQPFKLAEMKFVGLYLVVLPPTHLFPWEIGMHNLSPDLRSVPDHRENKSRRSMPAYWLRFFLLIKLRRCN